MSKPITRKRKAQFSVALIVFPILILIILEVSLRLLGYGNKTKLFFRPKYVKQFYLENLEAYNKYQDKDNQLKTNHITDLIRNMMPVQRQEGTLRGFVVGGSAAQGFPYNSNMSFSKMIENALLKTGKYNNVEVLNFGVSAISSYSVRDISKKLTEYDPDFLIVYAGNNEYYGAFSHTTGGSHFTRNMYMQLYELKLFQLVNDFVSVFGGKEKDSKQKINLMKERFRNTTLPKNEETDKQVAQNYTKNIKAILQLYAQKNIPVIVASPVSNLIDMPPFGSEDNEEVEQYVKKINSEIEIGNISTAENALKALKNKYNVEKNAYVTFLDAKLKRAKTDSIDLSLFRKAKNYDIIPFRPRSELINQLRIMNEENNLDNVYFFEMETELTKLYSDSILSNDIFIDHVHFNQFGHKAIAEIFSNKVAEKLNFSENEKDSIKQFFNKDSLVYMSVYSLPMYRLYANKLVSSLLSQPPFNTMSIRFIYSPKELSNAINDLGVELSNQLLQLDMSTSFGVTIDHYMKKENFSEAEKYVNADRYMFPGTYTRYLNIGRFYVQFTHSSEDADRAFEYAYLLAEKQEKVFNQIMNFYAVYGLEDKAKAFIAKNGKPE